MTISTQEILTGTIDCHAHKFDGEDGYATLVELAETYGIIIRDSSSDEVPAQWIDWAWWYTIEGPRENIIKFLTDEYTDDDDLSVELVDGFKPKGN